MSVSDPHIENAVAEAVVEEAAHHPVVRNTLFLTVSQVVTIPLSVLTNALTARYLGAAALGYMYVGATFNALGFLIVDWGQSGVLPAMVAVDRRRSGSALATSLVWRLVAGTVVAALLFVLSGVMGYSSTIQMVVVFYSIGYLLSSICNTYQGIIVGFERGDIAAWRQVIEQFAAVAFLVPVLLAGGGVVAALIAGNSATLAALVYVMIALPAVARRFSFSKATLIDVLKRGTPFVTLQAAMVLQPAIDALFLSKMASADVVGWYSAARRLIGFLVFPAGALVGALYPTLCRLRSEDASGFTDTARGAMRWTSALVTPIALGCLLYPDVGVALYNRSRFAPTEDNLRVLSLFLFLMYFTMPLGICVLAAGRQRAWAVAQSLCIGVSLILDPLLIPYFEARLGNGGIGLCVAAVVSEVTVLVAGLFLVPAHILNVAFWTSLVPIAASGAAMSVVAVAARNISPFAAAPLAFAVYVLGLWTTGVLNEAVFRDLRAALARKVSRA